MEAPKIEAILKTTKRLVEQKGMDKLFSGFFSPPSGNPYIKLWFYKHSSIEGVIVATYDFYDYSWQYQFEESEVNP